MKATPKADIGMPVTAVEPAKPIQASGILMKEAATPVAKPTPISAALRPLVAGLDGLGGGDARRPGARRREDAGIEHPVEQVGVEQHGEEGARQHRQHEIRPAEQPRDADGSSRLLAAPKVAEEIALWARFCTWIER